MSDESQTLLNYFSPLLYRRNPYQLLGLTVDSTPRDIRRRKEDIQTEIAVGHYSNEFSILSHGGKVDEQALADAFVVLEDPSKSLFAELFWFWPLTEGDGKQDEAIMATLSNTDDGLERARQLWHTMVGKGGRKKIVATHNLAVLYHMGALEAELYRTAVLTQSSSVNLRKEVDVLLHWRLLSDVDLNSYWEESIKLWNLLFDDEDFWEILICRVHESDDPRLKSEFVFRLEKEFPMGFDKVNAELAEAYAKAGKHDDAKRHVRYMQISHQGLDDVESTVQPLVRQIQNRISAILDKALEQSKGTVYLSPKIVDGVLRDTKDSLSTAQTMLEANDPMLQDLVDSVVSVCAGIMIRCGNAIKNWKVCVEYMDKLILLPTSPELKERIRQNREIAKANVLQSVGSGYSNMQNRESDREQKSTNGFNVVKIIFGLVVLGVIFVPVILEEGCDGTSSSTSDRVYNNNSISRTTTMRPPPFTEPAYPLPYNGEFKNYSSKTALAPFKISTRGTEHYYVKLVDVATGRTVCTLFVRGGQSVEVVVPLGNYTMKSASGTTWYGTQHLFGPDTSCSVADSTFRFYETTDGYMGNQVTLYKVSNGNLSERSIPMSQF